MEAYGCPHCGSALADPRFYCPHCTRPVRDYIHCESCREPIISAATKCPHCNAENRALLAAEAAKLEMVVTASPFGAFFTTWNVTSLFKPPIIQVSGGKLTTTVWTFFALREHKSEIELSRIASVRQTKGVIWSDVIIETFGGAMGDMGQTGLRHPDAAMLAESLKQVVGKGSPLGG